MIHKYSGIVCFLLLFLLTGPVKQAHAQTNISGVINAYAKVTGFNPANSKVRVAPVPAALAAGDKVLILQMKGAAINTTNTNAYGTMTALNGAGLFEYAYVLSIVADTVAFTAPLCRNYSVPDSVQLVRVPVYSGNVNVTGALAATPWATIIPGAGGVIAFEATGSVTLNANIDASNAGFRGGYIWGTTFCSGSNFYVATNTEGLKGEGIAHWQPNQFYGRGRLATGGGASGAANTGGGGGAHYGNGGNGGLDYNQQCTLGLFSYGGNGLVASSASDRVWFGGGGGGPQRDNGQTVANGGNGGGIVLIKAASITGNSFNIRANGQSITTIFNDEGGSGGGAGGSIYLSCPAFTGPLTLEAKGGAGSSNNNLLFSNACHGPGGGGGGGVIWFSTAAVPAGTATSVTGGAAGTVNNPAASCYNTTYGAVAGSAGSVKFSLTDPNYFPQTLKDTVICSNTSQVTLNIGTGFTNILWSTGATTPTVTVTGPGTYTVTATSPLGCVVKDTAVVTLDKMTLGPDTTICKGATHILQPKPVGNFTSYSWNTGATTPSIPITQTGTYSVTVQSIYGCTLRDTINITLDSPRALRDTFICSRAEFVTLDLGPGYQSAFWSNATTGTSITVNAPNIYTVIGTRTNGCVFFDTAVVTLDTLSLGPDTLVCGTINYLLNAYPGGFASYLWQDGQTTTQTYLVTSSGNYSVAATAANGCVFRDTVRVEVDSIPTLRIVATDSAFCEGQGLQFIALHTMSGFTGLGWTLGDGTVRSDENPVVHAYDSSGTYIVIAMATYRKCPSVSDTDTIIVKPFPVLNLGPDTALCVGGAPIRIGDPALALIGRFRWNTGDTTATILARNYGTFYASVTLDGCTATDTLEVRKDCYLDIPNVFTPDGDGLNDYFLPRILLSKSVTKFHMSIFNRWGQIIFESSNINGRGWDGKFNDIMQPQGVFVYRIDASLENDHTESYTGNVTLLR